MYGHKAEDLEDLTVAMKSTLDLLGDLKAGKVKIEEVDVSDHGWSIVPINQNGNSEEPIPTLVEEEVPDGSE